MFAWKYVQTLLCKTQGNKKSRLNIKFSLLFYSRSNLYFFRFIFRPKLKIIIPIVLRSLEPIVDFEKNTNLGSVETNKYILSENIFFSFPNKKAIRRININQEAKNIVILNHNLI